MQVWQHLHGPGVLVPIKRCWLAQASLVLLEDSPRSPASGFRHRTLAWCTAEGETLNQSCLRVRLTHHWFYCSNIGYVIYMVQETDACLVHQQQI